MVLQDRCAMKVSTDAVILGAIAGSTQPVRRILDVGTGTGVLALMFAQRYPKARVVAVEIDRGAAGQAKENVESSSWADRISVCNGDFREFDLAGAGQFDMVVSNPPYYSNHLLSADTGRNHALHQGALSFEELAVGAFRMLAKGGVGWVILPPRQMADFERVAGSAGFFGIAMMEVYDRADKPLLRVIRGFSNRSPIDPPVESTLFIKEADGSYSDAYRQLLGGFLLNF